MNESSMSVLKENAPSTVFSSGLDVSAVFCKRMLTLQGGNHRSTEAWRQDAIRVQKEEDLADSRLGSDILTGCSTASALKNPHPVLLECSHTT